MKSLYLTVFAIVLFTTLSAQVTTPSSEKTSRPATDSISTSTSGYWGCIGLGFILSVDGTGRDGLKIDFVNGYRFNPYFAVGAGVGFRGYAENFRTLPVYLHLKVNLLDKPFSPFIALSGGADVGIGQGKKSGGYFSPAIGIGGKASAQSSMFFKVSFEYHEVGAMAPDYAGFLPGRSYKEENNGIAFTVGVAF